MPEDDDPLAGLRNRAYQLADTGRYEDWASLSAEMVDEGAADVIVRRLTHDGLFQIMIKNRISVARNS
jgi:hypothetical protein